MPCHRFHLSWCRNTKDVKILTDIAKILINSEKPTPFGGIFSKTGRFARGFPLSQSGIQWPIWDEKNVRNADREALRTGNRRTSGFRRTVRVGASPEQNTDRTDAVGTRSIGFTINSLHPTLAVSEILFVVGGSRLKDLGTLAGHAFGTHDPA